ncbi:MAG: hypothetical protein ACOY46_08765 [Bacillota bacterium]
MKWVEWLKKWNMSSLKITAPYLEMEFTPQEKDKDAAWELYIEMLTRITTQNLLSGHGDEETALKSIYSIFDLTRNILKTHGRGCMEFTKIAIVVLNQIIRPFTSKWHRLSLNGAFKDPHKCKEFRKELEYLQEILRNYTKMLSDMAGVEDLTTLEESP